MVLSKKQKDWTIQDLRNMGKDELIGVIVGIYMENGLFIGKLKRRVKQYGSA